MRPERAASTEAVADAVERIAVVVNRNAGRVRRRPALLSELTDAVGRSGEVFATADVSDLMRAITKARASGADTIGICGGDGSNLHTLTTIAQVYKGAPWPRIVFLPGGTLNTAAGHFQARSHPVEHLRRIVQAEHPHSVATPLLKVNDRIGLIFGSLMVAKVLDTYYDGYASPTGAVVLASRIVASAAMGTSFSKRLFQPEEVEVELDGEVVAKRPLTALLASVVASPAVGMRVHYRAGENGCFHVIGTAEQPTAIVREAGKLWAGLPMETMCVDAIAKRAVFQFEQPTRYTMDGDMFEADRIDLAATSPVTVLLPPLE